MEIKRVCEKCGEINTINKDILKSKDVYDTLGEHYIILYYDCERCKEKHVLQIDSEETYKMSRELKKLIVKVARKRIQEKGVSKKEIEKKNNLTEGLKVKRVKLEDIMTGKKIFDENKKIVIEQLTFPKVGDIIDSNL